jgi:ADP-ribose pyrophosphatase YjhB (NUDIX family)
MRTKFKKIIIHILYTVYKIVRTPILWYQRKFNIKTKGVRVMVLYQNEILLVRHWYNGIYVMPGGGVHKNESPEIAAWREVKEETGIVLDKVDNLLGVYSNNKEGKNDTVYCYVFKLKQKISPSNTFNLEIADRKWFDIEHLPESVSKATIARIHEYDKGEISDQIRAWS